MIGWKAVAASERSEDLGAPGADEVLIGPNAIIMPIGRILLVNKELNYGAVKFIKFWTGKTEQDLYATYESYYQADATGNFSNKNVKFIKGELYDPKPSRFIFGHPWAPRAKKEIKCGPFRLWWTGKGTVYFYGRYQTQGDYGIELAPTPWTDISQVNVFDPRIKWYRYDETRKDVYIPIDKLWRKTEEN